LNQQYSHSLSSHYSILFPSAPRDAKGVQKNSQFRAEDALHGAAAAQLRPDELRAAQQRLEQLKRRQAAREALQEALRRDLMGTGNMWEIGTD